MSETNGSNGYSGSNGVLNSMPTWVRIAAFLGVPTFFATILLTFVLKLSGGQMSAILSAQETATNAHTLMFDAVKDAQDDVHAFQLEHQADDAAIKQILQEMCAQGAAMSGRPLGNCFPKRSTVPKDPEWKK